MNEVVIVSGSRTAVGAVGGSLKDMFQNAVLLNLPEWFIDGASRYAAKGWSTDMDDFIRQLAPVRSPLFPEPCRPWHRAVAAATGRTAGRAALMRRSGRG